MNDIPYTTGRNSKKYLPVSVTQWWLLLGKTNTNYFTRNVWILCIGTNY